jgi:hypothetical protein
MGYSIFIGDIVDGEAQRMIELVVRPDAPPSSSSRRSNDRHPSYSDWSKFLVQTGLTDWWDNPRDGVGRTMPLLSKLTEKDADLIAKASMRFLKNKRRMSKVDFDLNFDRIEWLLWWVSWAVDNCKNPGIYVG